MASKILKSVVFLKSFLFRLKYNGENRSFLVNQFYCPNIFPPLHLSLYQTIKDRGGFREGAPCNVASDLE